MLAVALARYLDPLLDWATLGEGDVGGNVFIQHMPSTDDEALAIYATGGFGAPSALPSDLPTIQTRVRGPRHDPRPGYDRARQIYDLLACLDLVTLDPGGADEIAVISTTALQSDPVPLGMDDNQRYEWTLNWVFRVAAPTTHRPKIAS